MKDNYSDWLVKRLEQHIAILRDRQDRLMTELMEAREEIDKLEYELRLRDELSHRTLLYKLGGF